MERAFNFQYIYLLYGIGSHAIVYVCVRVQGRVLDSWGVEHNAAAPPPQSPVKSTNPMETITLIPFGATELRISEFPVLDEP